MEQKIFEECLKHYRADFGLGESWQSLADKYGYKSGEYLRSMFKNERKKRGIKGKNQSQIREMPYEDKPRVAVCDIETLPMVCYSWGMYDQYFNIDNVVHDTCFLSWAGKYLNEPDMYSDVLTSDEALKRDSHRIIKSCWDFLSNANIVIGHNYLHFDFKILNTEFLKHGLPPLKYVIVDTYLVAKKNFRFSSNKMEFINRSLGIRNKISNEGFKLWVACSEGKKEALEEMLNYNIGDIYSTEELFYRVRPYVRNFNVALYNEMETHQCPVCGGETLNSIGYYYTPAGKWESVRCGNCGCVSRKKTNFLNKYKKKSLLINS